MCMNYLGEYPHEVLFFFFFFVFLYLYDDTLLYSSANSRIVSISAVSQNLTCFVVT